jgi:hypothetical protein
VRHTALPVAICGRMIDEPSWRISANMCRRHPERRPSGVSGFSSAAFSIAAEVMVSAVDKCEFAHFQLDLLKVLAAICLFLLTEQPVHGE